MRTFRDIQALAATQHNLVRTSQTGAASAVLGRAVASGLLYRRYHGVYSTVPELTRDGEWLAAVFAAGDGAALTALNAAVFYVDSRFAPVGITVAVPTRRRSQGFKLIVGLDSHDIRVRNHIPVTSFERVLIDVPLEPEQCANLIHEAAFRRVFSAAATRRLMARTPGRHGKLERAIAMHEAGSAGTRSNLEDRFMTLVRQGKFPMPVINTHIHGVEVDFRWGEYCVEVDGPQHDERTHTWANDRANEAKLQAHGLTVVRFSAHTVDHEPGLVLRELAAQKLARRVARK